MKDERVILILMFIQIIMDCEIGAEKSLRDGIIVVFL